MGIGLSIGLVVAGAILVWAVTEPYDLEIGDVAVNLDMMGWILLIVGVIGIILALVMNAQRSRTKHTVEESREQQY
ncbi:MAG: hypothetical protein GEU93_20075 [Propionibacteriales bacterium]|nr:hypothetical protein [Propionibacteriales bacterium]